MVSSPLAYAGGRRSHALKRRTRMTNVSVMRADKATETTAAEFHARVDALLPLIENRAAEAENLGRLTDDLVDALRKLLFIFSRSFARQTAAGANKTALALRLCAGPR